MNKQKHGLSKHPVYAVWSGMHQRCGNSKCREFKNYGGRGIIDRWLKTPGEVKIHAAKVMSIKPGRPRKANAG